MNEPRFNWPKRENTMTTIKRQIIAWIALAVSGLGLVFWSGCALCLTSINRLSNR